MERVRQLAYEPRELLMSVDLHALSAARAYDHFTDPELLRAWWSQEADNHAVAGGEYHLAWPVMGWHLRGAYTVCRPPVQGQPGELEFTWAWDHEPNLPTRTVNLRFDALDDGCRLTLRHGSYGLSDVEQADRHSHVEGWIHFLGKLIEATES